MRNRLAGILLLIAMLTGCTMWPERKTQHWQEATGGEGLERSFWNEIKAKNWVELERHMAGNYSLVSSQGRLDRAAALDHIRQFDLKDFSLGEMQVELSGQTLVVTYTIVVRGTRAGQPLPSAPVRMMSVWQHQKSGWIAVAHSVVGSQ